MKKIGLLTILLLLTVYTATLRAAEMPSARGKVAQPEFAQQASSTPIAATPTATPPPSGPQPGAAGIGDSYYETLGNGGYDVAHYSLDLAVDMASGVVTGTMIMTATASHELSQFNLDFQGFEISVVTINGQPAQFDRAEQELTLIPKEPLPAETEFTALVAYSGVPEPVPALTELPFALGWIHEDNVIYVIGEPNGAAAWYPVNDHPQDKATYTFHITVPKPFVVVANGLLQETIEQEETITYIWETGDPMASYLATVSIGDYVVQEEVVILTAGDAITETAAIESVSASIAASTISSSQAVTATTALDQEVDQEEQETVSLPIRHYFPADWELDNVTAFSRTAEMIGYYSGLFGPYPFDAYGVVVVDTDWPHALESQTLPVIGGTSLVADPADEQVAAQMLAHQWFGASVSPHQWQDLWLSDGFATYAAWLWIEHSQGPEAFEQHIRDAYGRLTIQAVLPLLEELELEDVSNEAVDEVINSINSPPAQPSPELLFNAGVSQRGALALHALRLEVADELFFDILRGYARQHRHGTASTADFTMLAEQVSGQPLADFFQSWLYAGSVPDVSEMDLYRQIEATVIIPDLRLRSGPGTDYAVQRSVSQDEAVRVLGQANDCEWLQIRTTEGLIGWISGAAEYVTVSQPCQVLPQVEPLAPPVAAPVAAPTSTPVPEPAPGPDLSAAEEHFIQGLTYVEQEQWDQAMAEFQEAVRLDPSYGPAYFGLGYGYVNKEDFVKAIEALERYLELVPEAENRAGVEADIQQMRQILDRKPAVPPGVEIPPGKALFVFVNYTDQDWNVDVGSHFIQVPANQPGQESQVVTLILDPGTYTWKAHSPGGGYYVTDANGNTSFEFTIGAGEVYTERVGGPPR